MPKLPRISAKDLLGVLQKQGFQVVRIRGSHHFIRNPDGRQTVVPVHRNEILGPGLLRKILRDIDLSPDQLQSLL